MTKPKADRNKAIVREYRKGATQSELAAKYGVSVSRISRLLEREGGRLKGEALMARFANGKGGSKGRPKLYADNPKLRDEYLHLRMLYPAAKAHEMLRDSPHWPKEKE